AVSTWRLASATAVARRVLAPALAAGTVVTVVHAAHAVAVIRMSLEDPGVSSFSALFLCLALAVVGVAAAFGWTLVRMVRAKRAVERLAVELAEVPPGALEEALARATGDPSLRIVYRVRQTNGYVDGRGRAVATPAPSESKSVTRIVRDGRPVALLEHDP